MVTQTRMTLEEFLALPETKPYREFVRGEVIPKAMPNTKHSTIVSELIFALKRYQREKRSVRVDTELRHLSRDEDRVYLPDVSLTRRERLPAGGVGDPVEVAPDFAIEVLSPGDRAGDVLEKVDFYMRIGVGLAWLVDPEGQHVTVYRPGEAPEVVRAPATLDASPVAEGLTVSLEELFAALPEDE